MKEIVKDFIAFVKKEYGITLTAVDTKNGPHFEDYYKESPFIMPTHDKCANCKYYNWYYDKCKIEQAVNNCWEGRTETNCK